MPSPPHSPPSLKQQLIDGLWHFLLLGVQLYGLAGGIMLTAFLLRFGVVETVHVIIDTSLAAWTDLQSVIVRQFEPLLTLF